MIRYRNIRLTFLSFFLWQAIFLSCLWASTDPWQALGRKYEGEGAKKDSKAIGKGRDPWQRLRAVYLPFTREEEQAALKNREARKKVASRLNRILASFQEHIDLASARFKVPPEIIGAVIMVESGGNPGAQARTSTAKGLMQTINATFAEARQGLGNQGVEIARDPFKPRASIMAGTWYLSKMYALASRDRPDKVREREDPASWLHPARYYYAGPGNGRKTGDRVIIYSGGRRLVIDKAAYSNKVMKWARILAEG